MLTVYAGATFRVAGSLQKDGVPSDFSGSTLFAALYDATGTTSISPLTVTWLDITKGLLEIVASSTDGWKPQKARIDCRLTLPTGDIVLGPPIYIRIAQSPLS
ncbi:hypothetical protein [Burkholderia cenocepacia]|uniref:hypothetical protein n=1 Tax=Burkholderia cenocepacia TaxID=95486 RepID=UPI002AB5EBDA|nr:hypothetical protein [Burkholderia cenocepacia]